MCRRTCRSSRNTTNMHACTAQDWISEAFRWQHGLEDSASNCTGISGDSPLGYELGLPQECLTHLDALYKVLAHFMDSLKTLREYDNGIPETRILACWHAQKMLRMDFPQHARTCRYSQASCVLPTMEQLKVDQETVLAQFGIAGTYQQPKRHMQPPLPPPPPPKRRSVLQLKEHLQPARPLKFRMPGTKHQGEPSFAKDETLVLATERPPGYPIWSKWLGATAAPRKG